MVPNRSPQPQGSLPNIEVEIGETATVNASQYFTEPDGESLTYSASPSDAAVAGVSVAGSIVTVTAEAKEQRHDHDHRDRSGRAVRRPVVPIHGAESAASAGRHDCAADDRGGPESHPGCICFVP